MNFEHLFEKSPNKPSLKRSSKIKSLQQPLITFEIKEYSIFGLKISESLRIRFLADVNESFSPINSNRPNSLAFNFTLLLLLLFLVTFMGVYLIEYMTIPLSANQFDPLKFLFDSLFKSSILLNTNLYYLNQWLIDVLLDMCSYYKILK